MKARRATLADVAERAGMSKTAVSLILNNRPARLSDAAIEKVRAAAAELNYRPNPAALGVRTGKTRTVGLISDEVTVTRFASAMIRGVLDAAGQRDHTVLMAETGSDLQQEETALEAMMDRRVDGVVFGLMGAKEVDIPEVPADVPVVMLNGTTPTAAATVLPDEYAAGYGIARVLLDRGHRSGIAILGHYPEAIEDPRVSATVGRRFAGIHDALAEAGVRPAAEVTVRVWEPSAGREAAAELLETVDGLGAIICANDRLAFGVYQTLQERGIRIPDDVSVVSFDDDEIAAYLRPGLTTARIPYEEMGKRAVELLLAPDFAPQRIQVPIPIVERESVRDLRPADA
jgi:LacI family transcriptional regulator